MLFPTPWRWGATVESDREYVAFTSRFFLKSVLRAPVFVRRSIGIMSQARTAPGLIGWSLASDLFRLEFYTLSAWEDAESLRRFVQNAEHGTALAEFEGDMRRKSIFVYYKVLGRDLPLKWKDAVARQEQRGGTSP